MIMMGSRGVIISKLLLLLILFYPKTSLKKSLAIAVAAILIFPFFFEIGNYYRVKYTSNQQIELTRYLYITDKKLTMFYIYKRIFHDTILIDKFNKYVDGKVVVNNFPIYNKHDGGVNFHTAVIDGGDVSCHSSGISGISDGYLLGGLAGATLSVIILFALATINDFGLVRFVHISHASKAIITFWIVNTMMLSDGIFSHILYRSFFTNAVFPCFLISIFILSKYFLTNDWNFSNSKKEKHH